MTLDLLKIVNDADIEKLKVIRLKEINNIGLDELLLFASFYARRIDRSIPEFNVSDIANDLRIDEEVIKRALSPAVNDVYITDEKDGSYFIHPRSIDYLWSNKDRILSAETIDYISARSPQWERRFNEKNGFSVMFERFVGAYISAHNYAQSSQFKAHIALIPGGDVVVSISCGNSPNGGTIKLKPSSEGFKCEYTMVGYMRDYLQSLGINKVRVEEIKSV